MKKTLTRTVKRGQSIKVGDSTIEIKDSDRGRVTVRVIHEEAVKVEIVVSELPLQPQVGMV